jgi:lysophospholipase L1-like esterase
VRIGHISAAVATACAVLLGPGVSGAAAAAPSHAGGPQVVALTESALEGVHGTSPNATVRDVLTTTATGFGLRIRLSNPFAGTPVVVRSAWVGLQPAPGSASLIPGSDHRATFRGAAGITLRPGSSVWTDPVRLLVHAGDHIAVSVYAPGAPVDDHTFPPPQADTPGSFLSTAAGDAGADESGAAFGAFQPGTLWWVDAVSAVSFTRGTIVTLGDSITDGYHADGGGPRWTDVLAGRINQLPAGERLSVANAGISGNTVSIQPNPYDSTGQCCGPPAPLRLTRDVLSLPAVRYVILLEGTNDIGGGANAPSAPASQVIAAMSAIAARVHAADVKIIGATVLPMCSAAGSAKEQTRLAVNSWIRTSGTFDAVLDFDAVLRDPGNPTVIFAPWDHDCYHPNAAGDQVLGNSINLSAFGLAGH